MERCSGGAAGGGERGYVGEGRSDGLSSGSACGGEVGGECKNEEFEGAICKMELRKRGAEVCALILPCSSPLLCMVVKIHNLNRIKGVLIKSYFKIKL